MTNAADVVLVLALVDLDPQGEGFVVDVEWLKDLERAFKGCEPAPRAPRRRGRSITEKSGEVPFQWP
jgi:hypothetical protein